MQTDIPLKSMNVFLSNAGLSNIVIIFDIFWCCLCSFFNN